MQKTTRSSLIKELETRVISVAPSNIDTLVTDGAFFLRLLKEIPETFGLLAMSTLKKVCGASNVYLLNNAREIKDAKMKTDRLSMK